MSDFFVIKVFEGTESFFKKFPKAYLFIFALDVFIDDKVFSVLTLPILNLKMQKKHINIIELHIQHSL